MRAKVIFTDGFHVSPFVETTREDLEKRLAKAISQGGSVPKQLTRFVIQTIANGFEITMHNTPEGRTFGGTMVMIQNQEFWPGGGNQAGVFLVHTHTGVVQYWGGEGFEGSPEFTKTIPQQIEMEMVDVDEDQDKPGRGPDAGEPSAEAVGGSGSDLSP